MARRDLPSPHETSTAVIDCVKDTHEKQKLCHELSQSLAAKAGGLQEESHVAGSRPVVRLARAVGCFCLIFRRRKPSSGGLHVGKEKLLCQGRCPQLTASGGISLADVAPIHREHPPGTQAHRRSTPAKSTFRVFINSNISAFCSGLRSLSQLLISVSKRCSFTCASPHSTSASGDLINDDDMKLACHQNPEEARSCYQCAFDILLKKKNRLRGNISTIGGQVRADSTHLIPTVLQRLDHNVVFDTDVQIEGDVPSTDISTIESELAVSEETINIVLEDPGDQTTIVLGGLSLMSYERIVLSVCPALLAVDTEL